MRASVLTSCLVVAALTGTGLVLGYTSLTGLSGDGMWAARAATAEVPVSRIAATNLAAAALLFSGVATGGVGSAVGLLLVSAYLGATGAVATGNLGWTRVLREIAPYAPLEFGGLVLVAVGGVLPVVHTVRALTGEGERRLPSYVDALGPAAAFAGAGVLLILGGAVVESAML